MKKSLLIYIHESKLIISFQSNEKGISDMLSSSLSKFKTWILMGLMKGDTSLPKYSKKSGFMRVPESLSQGIVVGISLSLKSSILMGVWTMFVFLSYKTGVWFSCSKSIHLGIWLILFCCDEKQSWKKDQLRRWMFFWFWIGVWKWLWFFYDFLIFYLLL